MSEEGTGRTGRTVQSVGRRLVLVVVALVVVIAGAAVLATLLVRDDDTAHDETPAELYAVLERAFRAGDGDALYARLDPIVLDAYGEEQCQAFMAAVEPIDVRLEVTDAGEPETWTFGQRDGFEVEVADAIPLEVTQTTASGTSAIESHVHRVDDQLRWFTDSGNPR
jgi:hypothetical protein